MDESKEVPWFGEPPDAALYWSSEYLGHLHFIDPQGKKAVVPVTKSSACHDERMSIWHIDVDGDIATVSPSVHYIGRWHTPNPVQFKLVSSIE